MLRNAGTTNEHTREISNARLHVGPAGQTAYSVDVAYRYSDPDAEDHTSTVVFVGSAYGGPVTMIVGNIQTRVVDAERFGSFGPGWVDRFYAA